MSGHSVNEHTLKQLFLEAHTYNQWSDQIISDETLKQLYDLTKMPPTSANCQPLRVVFLRSDTAKQELKPFMAEGNIEKTISAPAVALLAYDTEFYEELSYLFPQTDAKSWFVGKDKFIQSTAIRNSSLQGGYFILAARALGLDCGPMSGFNAKGVNEHFFSDGRHKINFICNLGYGEETSGYNDRNPRFMFDQACKIL